MSPFHKQRKSRAAVKHVRIVATGGRAKNKEARRLLISCFINPLTLSSSNVAIPSLGIRYPIPSLAFVISPLPSPCHNLTKDLSLLSITISFPLQFLFSANNLHHPPQASHPAQNSLRRFLFFPLSFSSYLNNFIYKNLQTLSANFFKLPIRYPLTFTQQVTLTLTKSISPS